MNAIHELPLESLAALMDALNFGAILIDQAGAIIHANERICTMLGRHRSDVLGRSLESLYVAPDDVAFARRCVEEFDAAFEEEFHLSTPDHTPVPAIVASRPLGDTRLAAPLYKLITAMDIGRLKKMEGRLTEDYQEIAKLSDTVLAQAIDLKHYSEHLEQKVRERTTDLFDANMDAIYMLAVASEAKDQDTGAHVQRIRRYTELLASEIGLPPATLEQYGYSAVLHDVGKMSVPDHVLKKPGPLSADERKIIQGHTTAGEHILGERPFFELARRIARSHHENWNGSGYPDRLREDAIPMAARIVRLVDVYDALLSRRVYKPAWKHHEAMATILRGRGELFDPDLVGAFERVVDTTEFREVGGARSEVD